MHVGEVSDTGMNLFFIEDSTGEHLNRYCVSLEEDEINNHIAFQIEDNLKNIEEKVYRCCVALITAKQ